jgi:leucyl/phenylalanyl-tRNA--protein transferase
MVVLDDCQSLEGDPKGSDANKNINDSDDTHCTNDIDDTDDTDDTDIVAVGANLEPETLLNAYRKGIFPWPHEGYPLLWFSPLARGVLKFEKLHLSTSLKKWLRKSPYLITHNQCFSDVIAACAKTPRPGQDGTWITTGIAGAYTQLHQLGYAHSFEAWSEDTNSRTKTLVGGIYGVFIDGFFSAESMFFFSPNASKQCLVTLIDYLKSQGLTWMDIQMVTPHMSAFGAEVISRAQFYQLLKTTRLNIQTSKVP